MRNKDNFKNSYDFIKNQLLIYDYLNEEHRHILKLKLWALDADFAEFENIHDIFINSPQNHIATLLNELEFLDRFIRTEDKKLDKYETKFSGLVSERRTALREWVREKDPITKERRKDYELAYSNRPTLLSKTQFEDLYRLYKVKEKKGELTSAFDIVESITTDNINTNIISQERMILTYIPPSQSKLEMLKFAKEEKFREDYHLVKEMNRAHEEIIEILRDSIPSLPTPPPALIKNPNYRPGGGGGAHSNSDKEPEFIANPVKWENLQNVIVNFPTMRNQVELVPHSPTHKGNIVDSLGIGGYRFYVIKSVSNFASAVPIPETPEVDAQNITVSPWLDNAVEWNFNNIKFAHYYIKVVTPTPEKNENNSKKRNSGATKKTTRTLNIIPAPMNIKNKERFDLLNTRWTNMNNIREDKMMQSGLRIQIESMLNVNVPDMLDEMQKYFDVLKLQKSLIPKMIQEICLFNEWK